MTDGPHFPFLALSLSVILHCDDGCPALCKYSPAPASKHGWHDPRWWSQAKFTSKINTSRVSAVMLSRRTVAIVQQEKKKKKKRSMFLIDSEIRDEWNCFVFGNRGLTELIQLLELSGGKHSTSVTVYRNFASAAVASHCCGNESLPWFPFNL